MYYLFNFRNSSWSQKNAASVSFQSFEDSIYMAPSWAWIHKRFAWGSPIWHSMTQGDRKSSYSRHKFCGIINPKRPLWLNSFFPISQSHSVHILSLQQYYSRDNAPEKPPDFSILAYANYKTLNRMNLDQLQVTAIRRGALDDNKDVWMVNPDWINVNPTESPFPDPYGMRQSQSYQMHLDQVLYATNTVTLESGYPVQKEAIRVSKIPYTIKDGGKTFI